MKFYNNNRYREKEQTPTPKVNIVLIGGKRYNYVSLENVMRNCGEQLVLEGVRVELGYCNPRGDILLKILNNRTHMVENRFILPYYAERYI